MATEVKHRTVNVSKAFVITRRFIGSVGTGSGTAKCKHCFGVNTHIRRVILSGMHCEIYKKKKIRKPLYKNNTRKFLTNVKCQSVWFGHQTG